MAGLSQEALAQRAGLSRRGIADLERGARRSPYPDIARRLADALELAPTDRARLMSVRWLETGRGRRNTTLSRSQTATWKCRAHPENI